MYNCCYNQRMIICSIYILDQLIQKSRNVAIFRWNIIRISCLRINTANNTPGGTGPLSPIFSLEAPFSTSFCTSKISFLENFSIIFSLFFTILQTITYSGSEELPSDEESHQSCTGDQGEQSGQCHVAVITCTTCA